MYKLIIPVLLFLFPFISQAATELYLSPAEATVGPGTSFETDVMINVDDENCINTVEASIEFDKDYMQIVQFLTGDSILNVWLQKPDSTTLSELNREGIIRFSGGIPGGYCGKIPGDPGDSNILARLVFKVPSMIVSGGDKTELNIDFIEPSIALINDGLGTESEITTKGAKLNFLERLIDSDNSWRERIQADTTPPEPFVIEIRQRADMFNGEYFLIFDTQDKQTGVDHFEVLELLPGQDFGQNYEMTWWDKVTGKEYKVPVWKKATINYHIEDQTLQSIIKVKAVDKNGNERIVEYIPPQDIRQAIELASQTKQNMVLLMAGIGLLVLIVIIFLVYFIIHRRHLKTNQEEQYDEEDFDEGAE